MKTLAIIQARTGSTRLPGKSMLDILGKPMLERVIDRVSKSKLIDEVMVATTLNKGDLEIVKICTLKNVRVFCGSQDDVLDRFYQVIKIIKPENVVRITADCPLIDYKIVDTVISHHLKSGADYTSNVLKETFPDGEDVEVFKASALVEAAKEATLLSEREHVTLYIRNNSGKYKLESVENNADLSDKRWTVDNLEDFKFVTKIYEQLMPKNEYCDMRDILEFLETNKQIEFLNNHIQRNEGLRKSLEEDKIIERKD